MKERPILFSGPMVKAILEGRKTMTRRIVKPTQSTPKVAPLRMEPWLIDGAQETDDDGLPCWAGFHPDYPGEAKWFSCPYGKPGDRLWVRETWQINHVLYDRATIPKTHPVEFGEPVEMLYRADGEFDEQFEIDEGGSVWRPSIFMPRWASRLTLEVVSVRVEQLQDISEEDAITEGVSATAAGAGYPFAMSARMNFVDLWDDINAKRGYGWAVNPFVWCVSFKEIAR